MSKYFKWDVVKLDKSQLDKSRYLRGRYQSCVPCHLQCDPHGSLHTCHDQVALVHVPYPGHVQVHELRCQQNRNLGPVNSISVTYDVEASPRRTNIHCVLKWSKQQEILHIHLLREVQHHWIQYNLQLFCIVQSPNGLLLELLQMHCHGSNTSLFHCSRVTLHRNCHVGLSRHVERILLEWWIVSTVHYPQAPYHPGRHPSWHPPSWTYQIRRAVFVSIFLPTKVSPKVFFQDKKKHRSFIQQFGNRPKRRFFDANPKNCTMKILQNYQQRLQCDKSFPTKKWVPFNGPSKTYRIFRSDLIFFAKGTDDREFLWHPKYGQCHRKWSQYPIWQPPDKSFPNHLAWSKIGKPTDGWKGETMKLNMMLINGIFLQIPSNLWNEGNTQSERKQTCTEFLFKQNIKDEELKQMKQ